MIQPTNPLDLGDLFDFDLYIKILEQVLRIEAVDGILFQHGAIGEEEEPSRRLDPEGEGTVFPLPKTDCPLLLTSEEELAFVRRTIDYPIFEEPSDALSALAISRDHYLRKKGSEKETLASHRGEPGPGSRSLSKKHEKRGGIRSFRRPSRC